MLVAVLERRLRARIGKLTRLEAPLVQRRTIAISRSYAWRSSPQTASNDWSPAIARIVALIASVITACRASSSNSSGAMLAAVKGMRTIAIVSHPARCDNLPRTPPVT